MCSRCWISSLSSWKHLLSLWEERHLCPTFHPFFQPHPRLLFPLYLHPSQDWKEGIANLMSRGSQETWVTCFWWRSPCLCAEALLLRSLCQRSAGQGKSPSTVHPIASISSVRWVSTIGPTLPGHLRFKKERVGLLLQTSPAQWTREAFHEWWWWWYQVEKSIVIKELWLLSKWDLSSSSLITLCDSEQVT